jgi:hypothetical protein
MDYLSGKLSEKEKNEVERLLAGSDFFQDAMEGLEKITDPARVQAHLDQLTFDLQRQLKRSRSRRMRGIQEYPWIYFTIALLLIICVVGYLFIRHFLH